MIKNKYIEVGNIMLSKVIQTEKDKSHMGFLPVFTSFISLETSSLEQP